MMLERPRDDSDLIPTPQPARLGQFDQAITLAGADLCDDVIRHSRWPAAIHDQCGDARTVAGGTPLQDDQDEGVTGKKIARENGFLIVARDGIAHPAVFSRFQIAQAQAGFRLVTGCVQQLLSIRRKHGAETAAQLFQEDILVSGFAITAGNLPKGKLRVVGERTGAARVIEIFTVWRSHDT